MHLCLGASSILSLSKDAQEGFFDGLRMPSCAGTLPLERAASGLPQTANAPVCGVVYPSLRKSEAYGHGIRHSLRSAGREAAGATKKLVFSEFAIKTEVRPPAMTGLPAAASPSSFRASEASREITRFTAQRFLDSRRSAPLARNDGKGPSLACRARVGVISGSTQVSPAGHCVQFAPKPEHTPGPLQVDNRTGPVILVPGGQDD